MLRACVFSMNVCSAPGTSGDAVETKDDKPTASNQEDPAVDLEVQPNLPHQSATNTAGLAAAAGNQGLLICILRFIAIINSMVA